MNKDSQFMKDLNENSSDNLLVNRGVYNLIVTIRDLKLVLVGIRPHRNFKLRDVKRYFGINGSAKKILERLLEIREIIKTDKELENV
tara:strand:+ start:19 stop:279 length:261 start_codon:yes stop_codon:yes gene_type:complete